MISKEVTIINKLGLHARAAAKFVDTACAFGSRIRIGRPGQLVDGKSIMSVMMLAASQGTQLVLETEGSDEERAHQTLCALIDDYFGEGQ